MNINLIKAEILLLKNFVINNNFCNVVNINSHKLSANDFIILRNCINSMLSELNEEKTLSLIKSIYQVYKIKIQNNENSYLSKNDLVSNLNVDGNIVDILNNIYQIFVINIFDALSQEDIHYYLENYIFIYDITNSYYIPYIIKNITISYYGLMHKYVFKNSNFYSNSTVFFDYFSELPIDIKREIFIINFDNLKAVLQSDVESTKLIIALHDLNEIFENIIEKEFAKKLLNDLKTYLYSIHNLLTTLISNMKEYEINIVYYLLSELKIDSFLFGNILYNKITPEDIVKFYLGNSFVSRFTYYLFHVINPIYPCIDYRDNKINVLEYAVAIHSDILLERIILIELLKIESNINLQHDYNRNNYLSSMVSYLNSVKYESNNLEQLKTIIEFNAENVLDASYAPS